MKEERMRAMLIVTMVVALDIFPQVMTPRQMSVYYSSGEVVSISADDTDSLTFSVTYKLYIHKSQGSIDSIHLTDIDSITFPFLGGPAVTMSAPAGGENYRVGDSLGITWTINPAAVTERVYFQVSVDNGQTWHEINNSYNDKYFYNNNGGYDSTYTATWKWHIKNPIEAPGGIVLNVISDLCKIRVDEYYNAGIISEMYDQSRGVFSISQ
jgi:hypothetical protein